MARDTFGFVWIGTRDGLARWDGVSVTTYRTQTAPGEVANGLPDNPIAAIASGNDGALWVGTPQGLAYFDRKTETFHSIATAPGCEGDVWSIAIYEGDLWTGGRSACWLDGDRLVPVDGGQSVGFEALVWSDGTRHPLATLSRSGSDQACVLYKASCRTIGPGYRSYGYAAGRRYSTFVDTLYGTTPPLPLPTSTTRGALAGDGSSGLWIGANDGLFHATPRTRTVQRIWSGPTVGVIMTDEVGRIWVGHETGVTVLVPTAIVADLADPLPTVRTNGLRAADGKLFVGTQRGLFVRSDSSARLVPLDPLEPDAAVWWIGEGGGDTLWVGTKGRGLFVRPRPGQWRRDSRIGAIAPVRWAGTVGGATYAALSGGLHRLDRERSVQLNYVPSNFVFASRDGRIWAGTDDGVQQVVGDSVRTPVVPGVVWSLAQTPDGALWSAMIGQGLCRTEIEGDGSSRCLTTADGLLANSVYGVRTVGDIVWASSARGLIRVDARTLALDVFTQADGLPHDDFDLLSHAHGRGDTLLFGGRWGYFALDGSQRRVERDTSRVVVSGLRVIGRPLRGMLASGDTLALRHDEAAFGLDLATPDAQSAPVSYRLRGYDRAWRTERSPTVSYASLPPGDYALEARAGGALFTLGVQVVPAWWQLAWVRALAGLSLLGLVSLSVARRVRSERRRVSDRLRVQRHLAEAGERERLRIARDLHDGPMQTLYQIGHAIDGLARDSPGLRGETERVRVLATGVAGELRGVVRALRPDPLGVLGLAGSLRALGRKVDDGASGIRVDVVTDPVPKLDESSRLALYRAAQEALANVVRHSGATQASLKLSATGERVSVVVEDEGRGFAPPARLLDLARDDHFGLVGVSERIEACGGRVRVERLSRGTRVTAWVPASGE